MCIPWVHTFPGYMWGILLSLIMVASFSIREVCIFNQRCLGPQMMIWKASVRTCRWHPEPSDGARLSSATGAGPSPARAVGPEVPATQHPSEQGGLSCYRCPGKAAPPPRAPSGSGEKATGTFPWVSTPKLRGDMPCACHPLTWHFLTLHCPPSFGGSHEGCLICDQRQVTTRIMGLEVRS